MRLDDHHAAFRTFCRKVENALIAIALGQNNSDNRRNNLARLFDRNGVANANVFAAHVIFVVQRRALHNRAGQMHWLQFRNRCEGPRPADLPAILETVIDTSGNVTSVRVLRGDPLLDQAAVDAVQQWKFKPATLNGDAIPVVMTVTIQFRLE